MDGPPDPTDVLPPFFHGWKIFSGICLHFFMGEKYFQQSASIFSWMKNIFRSLPPFFMGETYVQEFAAIFSWVNNIFRNLPPICSWMKNIFRNLPPIFSWVGPGAGAGRILRSQPYSRYHNYNPPCEDPSDNRNPPPLCKCDPFWQ